MPTLYVTGDSFSHIPPGHTNPRIWSIALANRLGYKLANQSMPGAGQDWSCRYIDAVTNLITPEDQLIFVVTDPARFWFYEEFPEVSNYHIWETDLIDRIGKARTKAIESYVKHIQRPALDLQSFLHRLGWLNNIATVRCWRKPLVVWGGFNYNINPQKELDFPNLIFSKGNLLEVSRSEELNDIPWIGLDTRYNHLCLSNHNILVDKIVDTLTNCTELNLLSGFKEKLWGLSTIRNPESELNVEVTMQYRKEAKI